MSSPQTWYNSRAMPGLDYHFCPLCGSSLRPAAVEEQPRKRCPDCGWVHYLNPLPCAAAFVKDGGERILLVRRGVEPGLGQWALPSGFIEIDESPEQACLRELREETGLQGYIRSLLGCYSQTSTTYKKVIIIGYRVDVEGELRPGSDSLEAAYFQPSSLPEVAFPSHRAMIRDGLKKK